MTKFNKERNKFEANMNTGERYYVRSPFEFRRAGKLGIESTRCSRASPMWWTMSASTAG